MTSSKVDIEHEFYPCCLTWTSIPVISWFFPFIGHTAICDMEGVHHDYSFPHIIHSGKQTILGRTFKYLPIIYGEGINDNDFKEAIDKANKKWKHVMHKYIIDNCHDYCVDILNSVKYKGKSNWNDFTLVFEIFFHSIYVNKKRHLATYIPSLCLWMFILLCVIGFIIVLLYQNHIF
ncbi:hypothetical protein, conserved [Entamoeba dispar SAW760]|uniref:Transmembrane protein n=1 Tax=Entamoeba dispar (strain ATCC PRA-260 / SAW760) TaxID=370354 RepID=B0EE67_ENTDS|nr:uncharacterized protein EDI_245310 [Entamoeba dispar SAW760]EDR27191.1 hypothetical protein, conserved [Entamoeba dispar SAW760]|eukprot:EDR27191.1 hypothetical protein, conserved [Entamoeba dispar SAW760]